MKNALYFWLIISLVFFLFSHNAHSKTIVIDSEKQYGFATDLLEEGKFQQAISEFERFIYFFPEDKRVEQAKYQIGKCYFKMGQYDKARSILDKLYRKNKEKRIGLNALFLIGESYYKQGVYEEAERIFGLLASQEVFPDIRDKAIYRLSWVKMRQGKWEQASFGFKKIKKQSPIYPSARELEAIAIKGRDLPYKSPEFAGVLAGIVPGMGHVYCGRYRDGLVSFILNGAFIWATIEAFDNDLDALGGILGFLEIGWYTGNIYSAINCAHKYNRKVREDFLRKIPDKVGIVTGKGGFLGLTVSFNF